MRQPVDETSLVSRWQEVMEAVARAAEAAGRSPESVRCIAVSKLHPARSVASLARAGHLDFGENYVQEALDKQSAVEHPGVRWHFIGRLQTNKAKFIPGRFHLVHSLDRAKLARALEAQAAAKGCRQPVLLQVNLGQEPSKGGAEDKAAAELAAEVLGCPHLELQGLMAMPPYAQDPEQTRPFFVRLRRLRDELAREMGIDLPHLSMGMSHDFAPAIEEGATLVRIGTRIFGPRP